MSVTPREIGTLVVVILKAQHLPNKQRIGKQDPFCSVALNGERRRTRAIKRGGQHPEWDEEVRFTLFEDTEDMLARTASESSNSLSSNGEGGGKGTLPPLPPKESLTPTTLKKRKKVKGGNSMLLACYADDPKEPELIGETAVDLTEVLTKGETDEWFTLANKDKFAGEVYLELTFWSNERPPEKKNKSQLVKPNKQYGGPGSFVPSDSEGSFGTVDSRSSIPSSLRSASSLAHLDLYNPPYERTIRSQGTGTTLDQIADEFGGLSVAPGSGGRRRESYPPPRTGHTPRPTDSAFSSVSSSHSYHSNGYASEGYDSGYDNPTTPIPRGHRHSFGEPGQSFPVYQSPYESGGVHSSGFTSSRPRSVSTMYSVPSASSGFSSVATPTPSGFVPVNTPTPSGFTQVPTGTPAPSGFMPPGAQAPVPTGYPPHPSQTPVQYGYGPPPTHTPAPSGFAPPPSAMGYHQPPAHIQPYAPYQQYPPPHPSNSAPPAVYQPGPGSTLPTPPGPPSSFPTPPHSAPPQQYPNAPSPSHSAIASQQYPVYPPKTPSPPQQYSIPPPPVQVPGSRPLPTPGQKNGSHPGTPPHPSMPPAQQGVSPTHPGGQPMYSNTPPHVPSQQQQQQPPQPQQQLSHPLPTPPGPPSQPPMTAGPPPAVPQNGFVPPPPPPPLSRLPGPPPVPPAQVYHHQSASDPSLGRGGSPTTRPPLPQPPPMGASNSGPLPPPGPPSFPSIPSSGFQPPPPPPPLPARRIVSTPHHSLPQPPQVAPPMPQLPRSVKPGEIFNPGPPPRPPMQMVQDGGSAFWSAPPQMQ